MSFHWLFSPSLSHVSSLSHLNFYIVLTQNNVIIPFLAWILADTVRISTFLSEFYQDTFLNNDIIFLNGILSPNVSPLQTHAGGEGERLMISGPQFYCIETCPHIYRTSAVEYNSVSGLPTPSWPLTIGHITRLCSIAWAHFSLYPKPNPHFWSLLPLCSSSVAGNLSCTLILCSNFHNLPITFILLGLGLWYFNASKVRATIPTFSISLFQNIVIFSCTKSLHFWSCFLNISDQHYLHLELSL